MPLTAVLLHYYPGRLGYLAEIIAALRQGSMAPDEIIIWDNGGHQIAVDATVINSGRNFGCGIRHCIGLAAAGEWLYFQDDDLLPGRTMIEDLYGFASDHAGSLVGISGKTGVPGPDPHPYASADYVEHQSAEVDIVLGRAHVCHKRTIARMFEFLSVKPMRTFREDDIVLSLANKLVFGGRNYTIRTDFTNLEENGIGLSYDASHLAERDASVRSFIQAGYGRK